MKNIAICLVGQLRSFSSQYQSLIDNVVLPLKNSKETGKVDIFINGFSYNIDDYRSTFDKLKYSQKLEIDSPGAEDIINKSPYIVKSNLVTYTDETIDMLFSKFNDNNLENFSEILRNKSIAYHNTDRFYNLFCLGLSQHYNNMNAFNQVSDEYDIIIRSRCDMRYLNHNLCLEVLKFIKNKHINKYICLLSKGKLWDQIFFGTTDTMKSIYDDFDNRLIVFYKEYIGGRKRRAENMLQNFCKKTKKKINKINLVYDRDFTRILKYNSDFTRIKHKIGIF